MTFIRVLGRETGETGHVNKPQCSPSTFVEEESNLRDGRSRKGKGLSTNVLDTRLPPLFAPKILIAGLIVLLLNYIHRRKEETAF